MYALGVDVGGTTIKFGVFDEEGKLLDKSYIDTDVRGGADKICDDIAAELFRLLVANQIPKEEVKGVGIGVPGPVLNQNLVTVGVNLDWYEPVPLAEKIHERTDMQVLVENDANVAALGEMWRGGGRGYENLAMFTLGTGVGGGIVIGGKVVSGSTGSGGEVGHAPILDTPQERTCGCGGHRCLELAASATGIAARARDELSFSLDDSVLREIPVDEIKAKDVFDAAKDGDALGIKIAEETAYYLGKICAIIASITNPECFVFGGGVSNAGPYLIDLIEKNYRALAFSGASHAKILRAELGNDAGIYGAAKLVL